MSKAHFSETEHEDKRASSSKGSHVFKENVHNKKQFKAWQKTSSHTTNLAHHLTIHSGQAVKALQPPHANPITNVVYS
jgi:hypothetical protein